jgi:hypothetical protein
MHITQPEICFQDFPVDKTFKKYLFETRSEGTSEKTTLESKLIGPRQISEPNDTSDHTVYQNKIQSKIEWYNERIKLHDYLIF